MGLGNAENHGPILAVITVVCYAVAAIGVALRCYVRVYILHQMGLDDWLMVTGLVLYTIFISFTFMGIHYGAGQHQADLPEAHVLIAIRYWYFCAWSYVLVMTTIKVSVGVFYLRIMVVHWQRLVVKTVIATVIVFNAAFFACTVAQCVPISLVWKRFSVAFSSQSHHHAGCLPKSVILGGTYLQSILGAASDWILGLLPIPMLWKTNLELGTKLLVMLILSLGALASISTLVRLSAINHSDNNEDFLWSTLSIAIWSTIEPGFALFAAGLATLRPLLRTLFPSFNNIQIEAVDITPGYATKTNIATEVKTSARESNSKDVLSICGTRDIELGDEESIVSRTSREIAVASASREVNQPATTIPASVLSSAMFSFERMCRDHKSKGLG